MTISFPRVTREQVVVLLLGITSAVLILSQFVKYPIFPKSFSIDFLQHYRITQDVAEFNAPSAAGLLYYGVHYNLALGYLLVGGDPFVQTQYLMGILVAPSSLLVYEVARLIYNRELLAILGQAIFVFTGFLWYVPLYNTGLYPNLYAILLSMAYLAELHRVLFGSGKGRFFVFAIVALSMYLSHYFTPIFLAAVSGSLLIGGATRIGEIRRIALPIAITLSPLLVFVLRPDFVGFALRILGETVTTGAFTFSTPLAEFFHFNPFTKYVIAEIYNNGSLVIFFGLPFALYHVWKQKNDMLLITLPIWLLLLWVLAPNGELAWRFSFVGLAPLILLSPATFIHVPRFVRWMVGNDQARRRKRRFSDKTGRFSKIEVMSVGAMVILVFAGSWTNVMLYDLSLDAGSYSEAQVDLYDSMLWFSRNTPPGNKLLTVSDWRIAFLESITGRVGQIIHFAPASDAISYAKSNGYNYLLVTYFIPAVVPPTVDLPTFYDSFAKNQNLKVVYRNAQDIIYEIVQ